MLLGVQGDGSHVDDMGRIAWGVRETSVVIRCTRTARTTEGPRLRLGDEASHVACDGSWRIVGGNSVTYVDKKEERSCGQWHVPEIMIQFPVYGDSRRPSAGMHDKSQADG